MLIPSLDASMVGISFIKLGVMAVQVSVFTAALQAAIAFRCNAIRLVRILALAGPS